MIQRDNDKPIVVFKHKSKGVILGKHRSIKELARLETLTRGEVCSDCGYNKNIYFSLSALLTGRVKYTNSYYYGNRIVVRIDLECV